MKVFIFALFILCFCTLDVSAQKKFNKRLADSLNSWVVLDQIAAGMNRVRLNTSQKQVYGTQVTYNIDSCQAIPMPLLDSLTVNQRRNN